MSFNEKFRERVSALQGLLEASNFKGCANLSTDLLRASEFTGYAEGIFIGEFFESLFSNVRSLTRGFSVEKSDLETIERVVLPVIQYAQTNIPFTTNEQKASFYDLLQNARCIVTQIQINYYREKTKKPTAPMSFPLPQELRIEEEE